MGPRSQDSLVPARIPVAALSLVLLAASLAAGAPPAKPPAPQPGKAADFFGLDKVHEFHAEIAPEEWDKMQKVIGGFRFPGAPQPAQDPVADDPTIERHRTAGFGMEFPWVRGTLTYDGREYRNVGVRYKGNGSYMMSAQGLKRNLKLEFDHYDADLRFLGLKTLNLNSESLDPTKIREVLAYNAFREAGVPAPRTAFAKVTLTVPGKYDRELKGLFTLVEQVDRDFLERNFQTRDGLLMKPEWLRGVEYLGDDWEPYIARYQTKREATPHEQRRFIEFTRLTNEASPEEFDRRIEEYLDVDAFLRFLGVTTLMSSFDSFLFSPGHNYQVYFNPQTDRIQFIPWDQDLAFAGFPMGGTPDQLMDLSLLHPHPGENALIDRLLAIPRYREQYLALIRELVATSFSAERLLENHARVVAATAPLIAAENEAAKARKEGGGGGFGGMNPFANAPSFEKFVATRLASVTSQLEGKSAGFVPGTFGPPGGNPLAKPLFKNLDVDQNERVSRGEWLAAVTKFFEESAAGDSDELNEPQIVAGLTRIMPAPPAFGPPPPQKPADNTKPGEAKAGDQAATPRPASPAPPAKPAEDRKPAATPPAVNAPRTGEPGKPGGAPPAPPPGGGFNPANFFATAIMTRSDTDKNQRVTREEFLAAAEKLFGECDRSRKGELSDKQLESGFQVLFPGPGQQEPRPRNLKKRRPPKTAAATGAAATGPTGN